MLIEKHGRKGNMMKWRVAPIQQALRMAFPWRLSH
jgi:hypothetical protein